MSNKENFHLGTDKDLDKVTQEYVYKGQNIPDNWQKKGFSSLQGEVLSSGNKILIRALIKEILELKSGRASIYQDAGAFLEFFLNNEFEKKRLLNFVTRLLEDIKLGVVDAENNHDPINDPAMLNLLLETLEKPDSSIINQIKQIKKSRNQDS